MTLLLVLPAAIAAAGCTIVIEPGTPQAAPAPPWRRVSSTSSVTVKSTDGTYEISEPR